MAAAARRLSASLGLAVAVAGAALLLGAGEASAAGPLLITAHAGYGDVVKAQAWMPLSITVTNSGPEVDGTLVVQSLVGARPPEPWPASYQRSLVIGTGATKHFRIYLSEEVAGLTVSVRIVRDGRILASQDAAATRAASTLVGVLSDDSTALDDFAAVHPGGVTATVVHLGLADLADSAIPLRAFDLLAVDDIATGPLDAAQRAAMVDYVHQGGSLLVGTGAAWQRTLAGLPAELLPMRLDGLDTLVSSPALAGSSPVQVATGQLLAGTAWLADGARPLLVESSVGAGTVTMAAFDWAQEPIASWSGTQPLLRQLIARMAFGSQSGPGYAASMGGIPAPFGGFGSGQGGSLYQRSGTISSVLGSLPALDLPSLLLTGLVVLVYVILIGPVNFLVLGALHRRALSWITLPLIAVLVAAGAYGGAILTKGQSIQTNQVAILHLEPGSDRAYQETYTGVLTPTRGDYRVGLGQPMLVSPISAYYGSGGLSRSDLQVDVEDGSILMPGMTAFTLRGFATEATVSGVPRLSAQLQEVNGQIVGSVENLSQTTFTDAVLIAGDSYQTLGTLAPGARLAVAFTPKTVSLNGPGAIMGIYPNANFGPQNGPPTDAQRAGQSKLQILSLLVNNGGFKGLPSSSAVPLLVAWTNQPAQPVTVNGGHPRGQALTAVAMELPFQQVGAGTLAPGVVEGRVVDVEGESLPGPPGVLTLQNGSVTLDFTPRLAAGARLGGAALTAANPYFSKGPGSTVSTTRGEAWDWSSSSWVDIGYQENGQTALPGGVVNPATGEVRLRVSAGSDPFMAVGISLVGTVQ
jgi:hypothetical protein